MDDIIPVLGISQLGRKNRVVSAVTGGGALLCGHSKCCAGLSYRTWGLFPQRAVSRIPRKAKKEFQD